VSPRGVSRTQPCDRQGGRARLRDAYAQLALADLSDANSSAEEKKAAASCAVLAGIAASDAACCAALGWRSRSQDHRDAVDLLREVSPGGPEAAAQLERLLGLKDQAQYGFQDVTGRKLAAALRQAGALVALAERAVTG
jgi:ferric-dicitrate binding protein FerR (iron transport regulator)